LAQDLAELEEADWIEVWDNASELRKKTNETKYTYEDPNLEMSRDQFAQWVAFRHLASNASLRQVVYFPQGAPSDEIRFLEIDGDPWLPEEDRPERSDFSPNILGISFRVIVADITPNQWRRIKNDPSLLPEGWSLTNSVNWGQR